MLLYIIPTYLLFLYCYFLYLVGSVCFGPGFVCWPCHGSLAWAVLTIYILATRETPLLPIGREESEDSSNYIKLIPSVMSSINVTILKSCNKFKTNIIPLLYTS